jgi:hypothetical protein
MKRTRILSMLVVGLCVLLSCSEDESDEIIFMATLNGANEATPNAETGTGSAELVFNDKTNIFTITVTYTGLTGDATGGHIHKGEPGVAGNVVFGFTDLASPITYTSPALDAAQEADLKAGLYYVNLHTAAYAGGEIRGQLLEEE